jgi:hypothetical protein
METIPLDLSATFENRELATTLVRRATGLPLPAAHSLVLTADATATAVLRTAGIPTGEARPVLAALWRQPACHDEPPRPSRRPLLDPDDRRRERVFVRDLGQCLHVIRHAVDLLPLVCRAGPVSPRMCCAISRPEIFHRPASTCTASLRHSRCRCRCWWTRTPRRCGCCGCCPTRPADCQSRLPRCRRGAAARLVLW